MSNILSVRIASGNRLLQYRSDPYVVSVDDRVLVQVQGELHLGRVERITSIKAGLGSEPHPAGKLIDPDDPAIQEDRDSASSDPSDDLPGLQRKDAMVGASVQADIGGLPNRGGETAAEPLVRSELPPVHAQADLDADQNRQPALFRPATEEDLIRDRENRELARNAHAFCRECIAERGLDMKLVDVEVLFDGSKMVFYFTAPNRIDFRELVKDLVRSYRTRIELRQIGARHETQMLGGLGNCGQLVCCQRFLRQFAPSTIKMAKEQNLFLNPAKISGVCNRLLCCLSYEQPNYDEFLNQCPKIGKRFPTSLGTAKVIRANYFRGTLSIFMEPGGEREVDLEEWKRIVSTPRDGEDAARREPGPRPGTSARTDARPAQAKPQAVAATGPAAPESSRQSAKDSAAARDGNHSVSPDAQRKKSKRSGRKGRPRPETTAAPDAKTDSGAAPRTATPQGGADPAAPGKSKRRSRSSRRKSRKQSGPATEQG